MSVLWVWLDDQGEEVIKELKSQVSSLEGEKEGLERELQKMRRDVETLEGINEAGEELIQNGPCAIF